MIEIPYDIDQAGWGSSQIYADGEVGIPLEPHYVLLHWGGNTSQITDEAGTLRSWQRYHTRIVDGRQVMSDIAYCFGVGDSGSIYRLRGMRTNGSNKSKLIDPATGQPWNDVTIAVVWIGGLNDPDGPSDAAYASMGEIVRAAGLPVTVHSDMKATACPGPDWRAWRDSEGWEQEIEMDPNEFSNPAFEPAFDNMVDYGVFTEHTRPQDNVTAEKLAQYLDRLIDKVIIPNVIDEAAAVAHIVVANHGNTDMVARAEIHDLREHLKATP